MNGWIGTILRVDLTAGTVKKEALDHELAKKFIGGRGLASKILSDEIDPTVDPLSPGNKLIFASGPLNGTFAPSASHYNVVAKGPLNGTIAASSSGGMFGPMLKYAGYDMVIFEGKAKKPVYLWIKDAEIEIRSAEDLWGKNTAETTEEVRAATDEEASIACIGRGGELQVLFANVMNEFSRAAGRSGVGAVMGSKNLKAISVRGTGAVRVGDNDAFRSASDRASKKIKEHQVGGTGLRTYGTDVLVNILNEIGGLPTRNFREAYFPTADKVGGETMADTILIRPRGCYSCIISCGRATRVKNPKYKGMGEGPEYESAWAFGPDCGIDDLDAITKANYICNEAGIDTITMGTTIACAMDLFENNIITAKDTDGIALNFGNADAMVEMVRKTAEGEGFGRKLALGSYRMAESYGHPEYSMSVKKQEMPAYDPRAVQGIGLNFATSNRGGCHVRGYTIAPEVLGNPEKVDPLVTEGKANLNIVFQNLTAALDSTGACLFATFGIGGDELAELLTAATGVAYSTDDFMKAGERVWNLERIFNLKAGFSSKDDTLPERILEDKVPKGPSKGLVNRLGEMLPEYYKLRGWDAKGVPSKEKLKELGL
ncbi:MAG TPA: aldehyde ferredoxin oxidoreductase family protein [Deltaproteobacteria bacterium]|nr:aldehyde ferredoxin oxidoreductase family protein [Deltaproteobacteria bacterium]